MSVAGTILQQLGGKRFVAFTGSGNFISDENSLTMTLTKNRSKANRLCITLTPKDTYTMRFYRFIPPRFDKKKMDMVWEKITEVAQFEDVYFDSLQDIFTEVTGLYTHF